MAASRIIAWSTIAYRYAADAGGLVMIDMRLLDTVHQDARYTVRLLWRAKAFTTAAVLTLALDALTS